MKRHSIHPAKTKLHTHSSTWSVPLASRLGLMAMAVAATGCGGGSGSEAPPAPLPEARGQALYVATGSNCIQCHTNASTMRRDAADATVLADRIAAAIAANTGRMGDAQYRYASLTRAELLDLSAYIVAQAPATAPPPAPSPPAPSPPAPSPTAAVQCTSTGTYTARIENFTSGLTSPWAMAFLPDRRVIVSQKGGSMVLVSADGATRTPLTWAQPAPQIRDSGQGGLLDIALDPDFATTPWVYFAYSEPGSTDLSGTAVGRASLQGNTLVNFQRLYQQTPKWYGDIHFGARLAFRNDRTLFVSLGDRSADDPFTPTRNYSQNLGTTFGKVIRLNRDGTVPSDNPFQNQAGARPEIWSLGHRNPQGLTFDSTSNTLWSAEHGPQGGDEVNRVVPGANYGWPLRSYGCVYGSPQSATCRVGGGVHLPLGGTTFTEPLTYWAPTSMGPSNMIVYRGSGFPEWNGQLFVGGLAGGPRLWRITLNGNALASCQALPMNQRIRDVRQGPDGWIWVLTDSGEIRRVVR